MTPALLVELRCPCGHTHWEIDNEDYGGDLGAGTPRWEERTYRCPACGETRAGYTKLRASPPEFVLPGCLETMSVPEVREWLSILRDHFPDRADWVARVEGELRDHGYDAR